MLTPCRRAPEYFGLRVIQLQPVGPRPLGHVVDACRNTLNEVVGLRRLTEPTYLSVISVCVWDEVVTLMISCRRSAVYRRNKIGPRTEPCGTLYSSSDGVELDVVDR